MDTIIFLISANTAIYMGAVLYYPLIMNMVPMWSGIFSNQRKSSFIFSSVVRHILYKKWKQGNEITFMKKVKIWKNDKNTK